MNVNNKMNMRELVNPPRMVYNSEDANFPLYTSCRESVTMNRRNEYSIELPDPAMTDEEEHTDSWIQIPKSTQWQLRVIIRTEQSN